MQKRKVSDLRGVLEALAKGIIGVDEAINEIRLFAIEAIGEHIRFDIGRLVRRDVPEIVYGEGKTIDMIRKIVEKVVPKTGKVIISRLTEEQMNFLENMAKENDNYDVILR